MDAFDEPQRAVSIGLVETAIELLMHAVGEAYDKRHERYLLPIDAWLGCHAISLPYLSYFVQFPCPHNAQASFPERL